MPKTNNGPKASRNLDRSIAARVHRAEIAMTGLESDIEIISALEAFGYSPAKRTAGRALVTEAQTVVVNIQRVRAAQLSATQDAKSTEKTARTAYADLAVLARAELSGDTAALAALGLTAGRVPTSTAAFLMQADKLFTGALSAPAPIQDKLAGIGYTTAKLTAEQAKITALHTAEQAQQQAIGDSQNLTPEQQRILTELDNYQAKLRKVARIALRETPQLLEKMGIPA